MKKIYKGNTVEDIEFLWENAYNRENEKVKPCKIKFIPKSVKIKWIDKYFLFI